MISLILLNLLGQRYAVHSCHENFLGTYLLRFQSGTQSLEDFPDMQLDAMA